MFKFNIDKKAIETLVEVLKDNNVVTEAEVEINQFSSKKAARKAVRNYNTKKANKAFQDKGKKTSNVKNFESQHFHVKNVKTC